MANKLIKTSRSQQGMSSFIIVATLAIILSFISIGSIRVSNRNLNNSLASQVQRSAQYAAESGVDQIVQGLSAGTIAPNATNANCSTSSTLISKLGLSKDTAITCALLDSNPTYLAYDNTSTGSSRVITLKVQGPPTSPASILVSWKTTQSTDPSAPPAGFPGSPATNDLNTALTWNSAANNYPPVLQLTFYPVATAAATQLNTITSKTFYLVPYTTGNVANPVSSQAYAAASSTITPSDCAATTTSGATAYVVDRSYDCRAIISGLATANDHYDLRILPIYKNADVKIQADAALTGAHLSFATGTQSVVDVTAKSGIARERLQARVSLNSTVVQGPGAGNTNPEYALRSAATLCKRLAQDGTGNLYTPVSDEPYCAGITYPGLPPGVVLQANGQAGSTTVNKGSTVTLSWTVSGTATSCTATSGTPDWLALNPNVSKTGGSQAGIGPVNSTTVYGITCSNAFGSNSSTVTVNVPSVCLYANPAANTANCTNTALTVNYGAKFTLYWVVNPSGYNFDHCVPVDYTDWGYGSQPTFGGGSNQTAPNSIGPIAANTTYTLSCFDSGGQAYNSSVTVSLNTTPPTLTFTGVTPVYANTKSTLTWTPNNATSCTATIGAGGTADWTTVPAKSFADGGVYTQQVGPVGVIVGSTHIYNLHCDNPSGSTPKTVTISIRAAPVLTLNALILSIDYYTTNQLSWNINDAASACYPGPNGGNWGAPYPNPPTGGPPESSLSASGTKTIPQIFRQTTYNITCVGAYGTKSASRTVVINPPSLQIHPDYASISSDGQLIAYQVGGHCVSGNNICGAIKNVDASQPGDSCTPTDSPSGKHNNWLQGPDGNLATNTDWLGGVRSVNMTPSGPVSNPAGWNSAASEPNSSNIPWFKLFLNCTGGGGSAGQSAEVVWNNPSPPPPPPPGPPPPPPPPGSPPSISMDIHIGASQNPEWADYNYPLGNGACADGIHYFTVCYANVTADTGDSSYNPQITCTLYSNGSAKNNFDNSGNSGGLNWVSPTTYGWDVTQNFNGAEPDMVAKCTYPGYSYDGGGECRYWHESDPWGLSGGPSLTVDAPCSY